MKSYAILLYALLTFSFSTSGAITKDQISETRTSHPYHAIVIKGELDVMLVPSKNWEITVEGTKDQVWNLVTLLKDDTLFVTELNRKSGQKTRTGVQISVNDLASIHVIGESKVSASAYINSDFLNIRAEAGAIVNLDVRALKVNSKVIGCSSITVSGSTDISIRDMGTCGIINHNELDALERRTISQS